MPACPSDQNYRCFNRDDGAAPSAHAPGVHATLLGQRDALLHSRAHPNDDSTAFCQLAQRAVRSSSQMAGSKVRSMSSPLDGMSAIELQTPAPKPAAMAAPSAVVSTSRGRWTAMPHKSAWYCSSSSESATPPSTRRPVSAAPVSAAMQTVTSLAWWAMPSSTARATCRLSCARVSPTSVARASSRQCGASSPPKAGTNTSPSVPSGTCAASDEISGAVPIMPSESLNQLIPTAHEATAPSSAYCVGALAPNR
mmetsp:Transcript_40258/g.119559  ORF Transcript_40258/g.119559 Transcript_40258/m.119559 type:complete len:253 (-) Transcript_40258:236-994(-)